MSTLYTGENKYVYLCGDTKSKYDLLRNIGDGIWIKSKECWKFPAEKTQILIELFRLSGNDIINTSPPEKSSHDINLSIGDGQFSVSGNTFTLKNCFKHMGGIWSDDSWVFPIGRLELVKAFIQLSETTATVPKIPTIPKVPTIPKIPTIPKVPTTSKTLETPRVIISKSQKGVWICNVTSSFIKEKDLDGKWNQARKCYIFSVKNDLNKIMTKLDLSMDQLFLEQDTWNNPVPADPALVTKLLSRH